MQEVLAEVGETMAKDEPWNERLWGPVEVLGLDSGAAWTRWWCASRAKTMPGKALGVERELRWRIKRAFDAAGIRIVGGLPPVPVEEEDGEPAAPAVSAPSAYASSTSPQSLAASPIAPPPNLAK